MHFLPSYSFLSPSWKVKELIMVYIKTNKQSQENLIPFSSCLCAYKVPNYAWNGSYLTANANLFCLLRIPSFFIEIHRLSFKILGINFKLNLKKGAVIQQGNGQEEEIEDTKASSGKQNEITNLVQCIFGSFFFFFLQLKNFGFWCSSDI